MKIAITAAGGSMSAQVEPNFGRCSYFIIYDTDTKKFEPVQNEAASMTGGAGPKAAGTIHEKGARILLTGKVGPNAEISLKGFGIEIIPGISGKVSESLENYLKTAGQ